MSRTRRILLLAGLLPALLVAAYVIKVALMLHDNSVGRERFDLGDDDGAASSFASTRRLNLMESWIAPFDEGATWHSDGKYATAIRLYEEALRSVPKREECTVRINLALAHEAVGDAAAEAGAKESARESWQAGIDALAAGHCPTDAGRGKKQSSDAGAVDQRLRQKLKDNPPPPQDPQQPQDPKPQQPDQKPDPKRDRLDENNRRGQGERHDDQDLYQDHDLSKPDVW
ncbi:hypothetical protein GCM10022237_30850 [Nocardioides ginsengisoli]|uniref:Tetratricopeptide repeat protein n=1 Tax=Nocardioides ginsengisoli TaxID=363868 RepID=A0ABW3VTT1_9ACTN